jgi:hypothetical protein
MAKLIPILAVAAGLGLAGSANAQDMPGMAMPPAPPAAPAAAKPDAMAGMDMSMTGFFGAYPMAREASGTSWQPDASPDSGVMTMAGDWMLMGHALINLVYDRQGGPRGREKTFAAGMVMGMAQRPLAGGTFGLRAMLSPDPLMGPSGYPLLLATGETADGSTQLIDRQHPHDLFMELAASYSHPVSPTDSLFIYAGLPGEPPFGPPAFMHRLSSLDMPEAPISHHWLDSTHITFGVITAGWVHDRWKLEASAFRGREPDQHRYDIEAPKLDSAAVRLSYNPTSHWSLQTSWANVHSPEQLEPDVDERRVSASAIYTSRFGRDGLWSTTLAWGRKSLDPGPTLDAYLLEAAVMPDTHWTLFGRGERVEESELTDTGAVHAVGKLSLGAIYDIPLREHVKLGFGALGSAYALPSALKPLYGSPTSAMAFIRLKVS